MKDIQQAIENICRLKGEAIGMQAMINAILCAMNEQQRANTLLEFDRELEIAQVTLLNSVRAGEHALDALETYALSVSANHRV